MIRAEEHPCWFVECDHPDCEDDRPEDDDMHFVGPEEARRVAELEGWTFLGELTFCPEHSPAEEEGAN